MKKIIKCITLFLMIFSLAFLFTNKVSAKSYTNNIVYEEVLEEDESSNRKLSTAETVGVVICSIVITAGIGFSIYWFILREKKEKKM